MRKLLYFNTRTRVEKAYRVVGELYTRYERTIGCAQAINIKQNKLHITTGWAQNNSRKELKRLHKENERLQCAVSDLTLDKLILKETASGNF